MKVYISGPTTGIVGFEKNFDEAVDVILGDQRFGIIINPVAVGREVAKHIEAPTWSDYMRADIKALCDCDAIVMLPGWLKSRGAQVERRLAIDLGMKVFLFHHIDKKINQV